MTNQRIKNLVQEIKNNKIDVYYLNTSDYHMSEYVPAYFKTIEYFSGFSGSLATLLVDKENAYIFVDGRYHLQAENQCTPNDVKVVKLGTAGALDPIKFIEKNYQGKTIGLDGKRTSIGFAKELLNKGIKLKSLDIYSSLIENRSPLSKDKLYKLDEQYTGESRKAKLDKVKYILDGKTHIVNNLESIAYMLNLRGNDIVYTPVFLSYLVFNKNDVYFFIDIDRLDSEIIDELYSDGVIIRPYNQYYDFLKTLKNETILLDENKVNYETYCSILNNGNKVVNHLSIIEEMKSKKNDVEIKNTTLAHIYDGVAMVRFLKWLDETDKETLNEYTVSQKLNDFRLSYKAFDLSFNPIVAYNSNAAMMHYGPTKENNTALHNQGILLVDSGGQYKEGTTDITRTIALGQVSDELKMHFTTVLKSMFNLSSAKFMEGMAGNQLDILARRDIWELGIDYRCGTGHGVGHVLAVHEAPPNIRYMHSASKSEEVPLAVGNVVSDEPGIYLEGKYGIRCENLLLVKKDELNEYGQFLSFKTLTLVPFDLRLIDKKYLDEKTIKILNNYHKEVYETLSPYLNEEERLYLYKITREI